MTIYFLLLALGTISGVFLLQKIPNIKDTKIISEPIKVSIIIPARNEEKTLPLLLSDLKNHSNNIHEIICVDDNSTDDTLKIIKSFGVDFIQLSEKPNDWTGKTWACQKGAEKSTGDILIFIDADVRLGGNIINELVCEHMKQGKVISVQPYHTVFNFYEHFAFFFNIIGLAGNGVACPYSKKKAGLFGPFILMSKKNFQEIDGYYHVRKSVVEDVELGSVLNKKGIDFELFVGDNNLSFRMYQNFKELFLGFVKNYASGASKTPVLLLILSFLWIQSMTAFPLIIIDATLTNQCNELLFGATMYVLTCLHLALISDKIGSFKKRYIVIYPCFLFFFHFVFLYSLYSKIFKQKVNWKGRDISLKK